MSDSVDETDLARLTDDGCPHDGRAEAVVAGDDRRIDLADDLRLVEIAELLWGEVQRLPPRPLHRWCGALRRAIAAEADVARLQRMVQGLADRAAQQSELLSRRAEGHGAELLAAVESLFPEDQWQRWEGARLSPLLTVELTCRAEELLALRDAMRQARGEPQICAAPPQT